MAKLHMCPCAGWGSLYCTVVVLLHGIAFGVGATALSLVAYGKARLLDAGLVVSRPRIGRIVGQPGEGLVIKCRGTGVRSRGRVGRVMWACPGCVAAICATSRTVGKHGVGSRAGALSPVGGGRAGWPGPAFGVACQ